MEEYEPICQLGTDPEASECKEGIEKGPEETANKYEAHSPQPSDQKVAKKRPSVEKVQVYGYMKKKVLNHLEINGCSPKSVDEVITASKFNKESILEYMNTRMDMAALNVHEECNSLSFKNIQKWLEYFKERNLPESCIYEPALVINAIANNEDLPDANELGGIDLKSVYKFLGNALLGLPQPKLNEKSEQFLAKEFEIMVGAANTDFGDNETLCLYQKLIKLKELPCLKKTETTSIDPLCLSDELIRASKVSRFSD